MRLIDVEIIDALEAGKSIRRSNWKTEYFIRKENGKLWWFMKKDAYDEIRCGDYVEKNEHNDYEII